MTYNKFNPTKDDTVATWLLRLMWPFVWGPLALAGGIITKQGWPIFVGMVVFTTWIYLRTVPLQTRIKDARLYADSCVDLKWHRKALAKKTQQFVDAGFSIPNEDHPGGPPITPNVLSYGPCPRGDRWVVKPIPGVQHGGDFLTHLRRLETAFERRLIVELTVEPSRVILIWIFSDPLSQTRRPDDNPSAE